MDNYQCEGYGVLALNNVLTRRGVVDRERQGLIREFCAEIGWLFDMKTEEEAEEQAKRIMGRG